MSFLPFPPQIGAVAMILKRLVALVSYSIVLQLY